MAKDSLYELYGRVFDGKCRPAMLGRFSTLEQITKFALGLDPRSLFREVPDGEWITVQDLQRAAKIAASAEDLAEEKLKLSLQYVIGKGSGVKIDLPNDLPPAPPAAWINIPVTLEFFEEFLPGSVPHHAVNEDGSIGSTYVRIPVSADFFKHYGRKE